LISSLVGMIDWLSGIFYLIYSVRSDGFWIFLKGFYTGRILYLVLGLGLGFFWILFSRTGKEEKDEGLIVGVIFGVFTLFFLQAFAPPRTTWKLFLDFILFGFIGIICGAGARFIWNKYITRILGGGLNAGWSLFSSLLLSGLFAGGWIIGLSLSFKGKLLMVLLAGGIFWISLFLNWLVFHRYSRLVLGGYLIYFLVLASFPFWFLERKPEYPELGRAKNPLNIIWIIADACRADALGIYGGENKTPTLDRLAREGILFKQAYSQAPWTLPSMLSMLSSFYPSVFQFGKPYQADERIEFISERLKSYGYHTYVVLANYLLADSSGILQGYDRVKAFRNRFRLQKLLFHPAVVKAHYLILRFLKKDYLPDTTRIVTEQALKILKNRKEPFFLYLHYMNPHEPYNPPAKYLKEIKYDGFLRPPFTPNDPFHIPEDWTHPPELEVKLGYIFLQEKDKEYIHQLYLAQVRYLDEKIKELLDYLKEQGLEKNTLVIFTADHGEEFWDHYQWGHGHSLHQELIHIPLIIWGAGFAPRIINQPIMALDLLPTLCKILGIPPNPLWQGKVFEPLWNKGEGEERIIFAGGSRRPEDMRMVLKDRKKLIIGFHTGRKWFFDLEKDPKEENNIYQETDPLCQEWEKILFNWLKQNQTLRNQLKLKPPTALERKEQEERLKAVGYIR